MHFALYMPVGETDDQVRRAADALKSVAAYSKSLKWVVLVNNAPGNRRLKERICVPSSCDLIVLDGSGQEGPGSSCVRSLVALGLIQKRTDAHFVLKLDADSLVIGPFEDRIAHAMSRHPHAGMFGVIDEGTDENPVFNFTKRNLRIFESALRIGTDFTTLTSQQTRVLGNWGITDEGQFQNFLRARHLLGTATLNGYVSGKYCRGAGYIATRALVEAMAAAERFDRPDFWAGLNLPEDVMMGLQCTAAGLHMYDLSGCGEVFTRHDRDAISTEELVSMNTSIVYRVAGHKEREVRSFFRERRGETADVSSSEMPAVTISKAAQSLEFAEACFEENRFTESLRYYGQALEEGADPHIVGCGRWSCWMTLGEFEEAWKELDRYRKSSNRHGNRSAEMLPHAPKVWDGSAFADRRVLVRSKYGLGDAIHFARYIPILAKTASQVTVECMPELMGLLSCVPGIYRFVPLYSEPEDIEFDAEVEISELAYAFRSSLETLPPVPYLEVPKSLVESRRDELEKLGLRPSELNVGLVWTSAAWKPERSVPINDLAVLGEIPGIQLFSLQRGRDAKPQIESSGLRIINAELGSLLHTAATMMNLDLIVSVDTMAAHLAGAIAKQVWTLLPFEADWRWMAGREDSPWYATMRLFRQQTRGNWKPPVQRLAQELRKLVERRDWVGSRLTSLDRSWSGAAGLSRIQLSD